MGSQPKPKKALSKQLNATSKEIEAQEAAELKAAAARKIISDAIDMEAKTTTKAKADIQKQLDDLSKKSSDTSAVKYELQRQLNKIDLESVETQTKYRAALIGTTEELQKQANEIAAKNKKQREANLKEAESLGQTTLMTPKFGDTFDLALGNMDEQNSKAANIRAMFKTLASDVKKDTIDLSAALASAAESFGTFLGDMASGKSGMQSFGQFIAEAIANLATTVGKQMIVFATAMIAFDSMLDDPWTALAAGIALVALGQIAHNAVASSMSSAGGNAASESGNSNYTYDTRAVTKSASTQKISVVVSGTLSASGKDLATTLSKENTRVQMAT